MIVTYIEKGPEHDFRRIDTVKTFRAVDFFHPEGTSVIYFRINQFEYKTIALEDLQEIKF